MTEERPQFDFESDVAIDLDDLHNEWAKHSQIRYDYAKEVAYLDKVVKQQNKTIEVNKTKLKAETGKLILKIKKEDPRATVQMIDAKCVEHESLKSAQEILSNSQDKLIDLEYDLNMAKNALKGLDDKKKSLEYEVELWKGNYFATPREKRDVNAGKIMVNKINAEKTRKGRQAVNEKRKRRNE